MMQSKLFGLDIEKPTQKHVVIFESAEYEPIQMRMASLFKSGRNVSSWRNPKTGLYEIVEAVS